MSESTNSYEQERRQKRDKLRELGVDPYGGRETGLRPLAEIKQSYAPEMGHDGGPVVKAAGRVVLKRDMGKLSFLSLRDESGDLQVALDKKRLDEKAWQVNDLIDLGDQIVVEGPLGVTKKGEVTIWATQLRMAAKALLTPPGKWDGLSDVELRYRQRYVDLWANPDVMKMMKLRMQIVDEIRRYLRDRGFLEVETPMMQTLAGGAAARPFVTHHNALDIPLYMRIAPELYLKRLLVGGFTKVFELNRNFRNEGISHRHNPEFTMLEAYEAFGSWESMASLVEGMICHLAHMILEQKAKSAGKDFDGSLILKYPWMTGDEMVIDLDGDKTKPIGQRWKRVRMDVLVEERTGWRFEQKSLRDTRPELLELFGGQQGPQFADRVRKLVGESQEHLRAWSRLTHIDRARFELLSDAEQLVEFYEKGVEISLLDPTFVTHVPSAIIPLAKRSKENEYFADVYELVIRGQEISPGYSELNDPDIQAANFAQQVGDEAEKQKTDEDFLTALKFGMPPAGGMGLGIDRLVMMLTGAESIRDVILFPLMRPS
jgi:lysyl-tRNA synthetase class 2